MSEPHALLDGGIDVGTHGEIGRRIDAIVDGWRSDPRLVHVEQLDGRPGRIEAPNLPLHPLVAERIGDRPLWSHQARAIDQVRAGHSVVVTTSTSSGKSLCYQVPAVEAALTRRGTSLMLFPTKALAHDQLRALSEWGSPGVVAATYDGDCTPQERTWVRSNADVVLTNPEMLHGGILANHARWADFLHRLELVVVDELHVLRGVFGTHVAQVLRRLRRLAARYGSSPRFVFTSATIDEPAQLASQLCGLAVRTISLDGSPSGPRTVVVWNPRLASEPGPPRPSVHHESAEIAAHLVTAGLRTLVFCRSRRASEVLAGEIRRRVAAGSPDGATPAETVRSYRAGYLADERREIEAALSDGVLDCVVATTALELGVDIGGLDAVVLSGHPGTTSSFWQQVGRSGRGRRPSLAVLVAGHDQLDQWMARHPAQLLGRDPERAVVNLDNPDVFVPHLACAAQEHPLRTTDRALWPDQLDEGVRQLVLSDRAAVRRRHGERLAVWTGRGLPAPTIRLRSSAADETRIVDRDRRLIGTVGSDRATTVVHPGAVYLHQGQPWKVLDLDLDDGSAVVEAADGATYTTTRSATSFRILDVTATRPIGAALLGLGTVEITDEVLGYETRDVSTHEVLERTALELPPSQLVTRAVWYRFGDALVASADVADGDLPGALHAIEHAAIGILPLFTICDRWDVGGVSTAWSLEARGATVVIHDAHPGGAGIAELAFAVSEDHVAATAQLIEECPCEDGCPSCVQSPKCGSGNEPLHKEAARRLLRATLLGCASAGDRLAAS